jgi:Protein of unknown function (DUF3987)
MWNERRDAHHLAGFDTIYVVVEPDHGGENMLRWIGKSSIRDRVRIIRFEGFKDPSEMHVADPSQFQARWDAALAASMPLKELARSTQFEQPRPLRRDPGPADPFPVGALGEILSAAARGIQEKVQAPIAICAQSVLAAATLAVQARADIQLPTGQARPIAGYFITVAGSGERKTSADREALWPISRHEQNLREQYDAELPGYLNARDAWEKQRAQILGNKRQYPDPASKRTALDELGPAPVGPLHPMLVCPEPTFEGLERLFVVGQPSMGVFSGEGGQFVGGHGMQKEAKLRTAAALSSLWDGDAIRRVRALDGATLLPGRRLSLHLMVQPDVANLLLCDRLLADQGLLSRLLVTAPMSAAGTRLWKEAPAEADAAIRRYGARLLSIFEEPLPLAPGKPNELKPSALVFDGSARRTWAAFCDHVERELGSGGSLEPVRGFANKLPEHAARLAAVLSIIGDPRCQEITSTAIDAGIELAQHYALEALRLFDAGSARPEILRAEQLLGWLQTWEGELISLPDVYQRGPNAFRDGKSALEAIHLLEDHGSLEPVDGGAVVNGTLRRDVWRIVGRQA